MAAGIRPVAAWQRMTTAFARLALPAGALLIVVVATLTITRDAAQASNRHALVIGIDAYSNLGPSAQLKTAAADARTMATALREIGFRLVDDEGEDQPLVNAGRDKILAAMERLKEAVQPGDLALVYFAGHGIANGRANLLLPADARNFRGNAEAVVQSAIGVDELERLLAENEAKAVVLVLDACRTDPFLRAQVARAPTPAPAGSPPRSATGPAGAPRTAPAAAVASPFTRGLVSVEARAAETLPPRTLVIHAADYNQEALDRLERDQDVENGVFTRVFARLIRRPGLGLTEIASRTRTEVMALARSDITPKQQLVVFNQNFASGDIYLNGAAAGTPMTRRELDRRTVQRANAEMAVLDPTGADAADLSRALFEAALATGDAGMRQAVALVGDGLADRGAVLLETRAENTLRAARARQREQAAGTPANRDIPPLDPAAVQAIARDLALAAAIRLPTDARRAAQLANAAATLGDTSATTRGVRLNALIAIGELRRAEAEMTAIPPAQLAGTGTTMAVLSALDRALAGRAAGAATSVQRDQVDPASPELRNLVTTSLGRLDAAQREVLRRNPLSVDARLAQAKILRRRARLLMAQAPDQSATENCLALSIRFEVPAIVERTAEQSWATALAANRQQQVETGDMVRQCTERVNARRADLGRAQQHATAAQQRLDDAIRLAPDRRDLQLERAQILFLQADLLTARGGPSNADGRYREAVRVIRRLAATEPADINHTRALWEGLHRYGEALARHMKLEDDNDAQSARSEAVQRRNNAQRRRAVAAHAEALTLAERFQRAEPESLAATEAFAHSLRLKVRALDDAGETDLALRHGRALFRTATELHRRDSANGARIEQLVRDTELLTEVLYKARLGAESCLENRTVLATLEAHRNRFPQRPEAAQMIEDFRKQNQSCMRVAPVEDAADDDDDE
jgi:hypothetical protein